MTYRYPRYAPGDRVLVRGAGMARVRCQGNGGRVAVTLDTGQDIVAPATAIERVPTWANP